MTKQILVIVERADDCARVARFMLLLYDDGEVRASGSLGNEYHISFNAGGRVLIKPKQDWDPDSLQGHNFNNVVFLCKSTDYLVEQVQFCLSCSPEEEEEEEGRIVR